MKKYKADYILTANQEPIKNGSVIVDNQGKILKIEGGVYENNNTTESYNHLKAEELSGVICPGFINTHCHLELSHLKGKIAPKEGLIAFIKSVQKNRKSTDKEVINAAQQADEEMHQNGIVAVGDIANSAITADLKAKSKLYYHNFVEVYGFDPAKANDIFQDALQVCEAFKPMKTSITPHAAYSVSKELFKLIRKEADAKSHILSIHNQETDEENKLFRYKTGDFVGFYDDLGIDISYFKPQARNSMQSILPLLGSQNEILLVHNTYTSMKDIYFVRRFDKKINWCFCPDANLFIEDMLPKLSLFMGQGFNITLGTDSLAANNKLSILQAMQTLATNFKELTIAEMIKWATINGAKFLGIDQDKGSIEVGKTPGLNLLSGMDHLKLTPQTTVKRLI